MENSLGIIGGADGPTAIFVSTSMGTPLDFKALLISVIAILLAYFIGNISPATLLAKAKGIDIKKKVVATQALRMYSEC